MGQIKEVDLALAYKEFYMKQALFRQVGQMTDYDIQSIMKKYPQARQTDEGIPVFGMISALNEECKEYRETYGLDKNKTPEENKLEAELKYENVLSKKILNQAKLSLLIPKEEAEDRMKKAFRTVSNTIKRSIKLISPQLVNITDQRDVEQLITRGWNNAIKEMEKKSKVLSWKEDGSADLLRTRLSDVSKQDPEFGDVFSKGGSDEQGNI